MTLAHTLVRRLRAAAIAALVPVALLACQGEEEVWGDAPHNGGEPLLHQLAVPRRLAIAPSALTTPGSFATARASGPDQEAELPLPITGGSLELWSPHEGMLFVSELEVALPDVEVPADVLPPNGAHLTDVSVRLTRPATLEPTDDGQTLRVIAPMDLEVTWALVVGDTVHTLDPLALDRLPISLEIRPDALGRLQARVVGFRDGSFWRWAGFGLSDLTVDLLAVPIDDL